MKRKCVQPETEEGDFDSLVASIVQIHHQAQDFAAKAVHVGLTLRNWFIGHRIVEFDQKGADRAACGERLLPALAKRLAAEGLKRVDTRELRRFRLLDIVYPHIRESVTPEWLASTDAAALQATTAFSHEHLGHLNTDVAYYQKHEMTPGDQPAVGILLCTRKNNALVEFALGNLSNQVFISRYAVEMPKKEDMERFLKQLGQEVGA